MSIKWNVIKNNTRTVTAKHHDFEFDVKYKTEFATKDNLERIENLFVSTQKADDEQKPEVGDTFKSLVTQLSLLVSHIDIEGEKDDGFELSDDNTIKPNEAFFSTWSLPLLGVVIKAIYDDMYAPLETDSTILSDGSAPKEKSDTTKATNQMSLDITPAP